MRSRAFRVEIVTREQSQFFDLQSNFILQFFYGRNGELMENGEEIPDMVIGPDGENGVMVVGEVPDGGVRG